MEVSEYPLSSQQHTPLPPQTIMLRFLIHCEQTYVKILKTIATGGGLAALECTKFVFGRCFVPDPDGGAYSAPKAP